MIKSRFRQLVNKYPQLVLDALFFDCYQLIPGLSRFSQLRSFLAPQASYIYPGIFFYVKNLHPLKGSDGCDRHSLIVREARNLCREIVIMVLRDTSVPLGKRKQLHQALYSLKVAPEELDNVLIDDHEVLANIHQYLDKADLLAELPQFQSVYFTSDELIAFHTHQPYQFSPDFELQLEKLLSPLRKRNILQILQQFIRSYPLPFLANQAFAVYISLGEVIPWHQHSFIKRLLIVSYQELMVSLCLQK